MSTFSENFEKAMAATAGKRAGFKVGMLVGARRWPSHGAHPDAWGKPWSGKVVAPDDPRAWADTLAFPRGMPTQQEVREHIAELGPIMGAAPKSIPVLWNFGKDKKVHWERPESLRPYKQDLAEWKAELATARKRSA